MKTSSFLLTASMILMLCGNIVVAEEYQPPNGTILDYTNVGLFIKHPQNSNGFLVPWVRLSELWYADSFFHTHVVQFPNPEGEISATSGFIEFKSRAYYLGPSGTSGASWNWPEWTGLYGTKIQESHETYRLYYNWQGEEGTIKDFSTFYIVLMNGDTVMYKVGDIKQPQSNIKFKRILTPNIPLPPEPPEKEPPEDGEGDDDDDDDEYPPPEDDDDPPPPPPPPPPEEPEEDIVHDDYVQVDGWLKWKKKFGNDPFVPAFLKQLSADRPNEFNLSFSVNEREFPLIGGRFPGFTMHLTNSAVPIIYSVGENGQEAYYPLGQGTERLNQWKDALNILYLALKVIMFMAFALAIVNSYSKM